MVFLSLFFSLAAPAAVSALPIVDGCQLEFGVTCDLGAVQFFVNEVNGSNVGDPRIGTPFAQVRVSVEAFAPSHPLNTEGFPEFEYRYQIFLQQYAVTNLLLDLSLTPSAAILQAGFKVDLDPNTISPTFAAYSEADLAYDATFLSPPLLPGQGLESDVLFIRSTADPADIVGQVGGFETFGEALVGFMTLKGPGSEITASSQTQAVPEPATVILLGSGLLALAAGLRPRQKETPQGFCERE